MDQFRRITAAGALTLSLTLTVPLDATAQSPQQVIDIFQQQKDSLVTYTSKCYGAGIPVWKPIKEIMKKVPGARTRPDLVNAVVILGGYKITDVMKLYVQAKVVNSPLAVLNMLQRTGLTNNQAGAVLNSMGGAYAGAANQAFKSVPVQTVFSLAGKIESSLPPGAAGFVNQGVDVVAGAATAAIAEVEKAGPVLEQAATSLDPTGW